MNKTLEQIDILVDVMKVHGNPDEMVSDLQYFSRKLLISMAIPKSYMELGEKIETGFTLDEIDS